MSVWNPSGHEPAHRRLAELLHAIEGRDTCRDDTLGERNQRLLRLHRLLVNKPLEASVMCRQCGVESEFTVPSDNILAASAPAPDASVRIRTRGRTLRFRLPRMSDIEAAGRTSTVRAVRSAVLERCRVDGDLKWMTDAAAEQLGREFEGRDPAATIVVNIFCSGCQAALGVSIDLATFVACDLDRAMESLYSDIHEIASAYGWDEPTILALPPERRRRYVSMISARRHVSSTRWSAA
jgi:hypothetical protein